MTAHSSLGASSAYRWMTCPGSVALSAGCESKSSPFAVEGQCAHYLGELCLREQKSPFDYVGTVFPEYPDFEVTDEMAEAVDVYVDGIRADMSFNAANGEEPELLVETRFSMQHIWKGMFGTNDACVYYPIQKKLTVYDYKHGQGIPVEVEHNLQMLYYAVGATTGKHNRGISSIELVIVQPRCFHPKGPIRRWQTDVPALLDFIADLEIAARKTLNSQEFVVGDHCGYCPAAENMRCKALTNFVEETTGLTEFLGEYTVTKPEDMTPGQLRDALAKAEIVKDWARSVLAYAQHMAERGVVPEGWKLVEKRGRRQFIDFAKTAEKIKEFFGFAENDLYNEPKPFSPAQLEAFLKKQKAPKKEIESVLRPLVQTVSSGNTLVQDKDPRKKTGVLLADQFPSL